MRGHSGTRYGIETGNGNILGGGKKYESGSRKRTKGSRRRRRTKMIKPLG